MPATCPCYDQTPLDNPQIRKAMALALDRKAFIDILAEGNAAMGGAMLPAPEGLWVMPDDELAKLPGYGPDTEKNRAEARKIMESLGYGPGKTLNVKVSTRNIAIYRDPGVILIDQLKSIHIDGVLEPIDTTVWYAKVQRKDYSVGLNLTGVAVDDPDVDLVENYTCKSERNYTHYCNPKPMTSFSGNPRRPTSRSASAWRGRRSGGLRKRWRDP